MRKGHMHRYEWSRDNDSGTAATRGSSSRIVMVKAKALLRPKFLGPATSILVDFWIFSDQAQLLDPESAASKEPRSGLVA